MSKDKQLATIEAPSPAVMMQTIIEKGITAENVSAFEGLLKLQERMEDRQSEKEFAAAFVELQSSMGKVEARKAVPGSGNTIRYYYAPFEDIMAQVKPLLQANGFAVSFDSKRDEGMITEICTLMHRGGHSRSNNFAVRIGKGPPSATESQADGSASTYAKRYALCNALNIVIGGMDDDARTIGESITEAQAIELRDRVANCHADEAAFLKFAGAANYESIPATKFDALDSMLRQKEVRTGVRNEDGTFKF